MAKISKRSGIAAVFLAALSVFCLNCGSSVRPFPLAEPLTEDPDRTHVEQMPEEYWSPFGWDAFDQTITRPLTRVFAVDPAGPSVNVNSFDEVPNSSWFTDRIGLGGFGVDETRTGACPDELLDTTGPWTVTDAKPNGANPGFLIRAQDGRRYLLKFDGHLQPERATSADVVGSRIYHAAGFFAPCNFIVFFDPAILEMDPEAEAENALGEDIPMTQEHVDTVLAAAVQLPDGRVRASASLFLDGRPIGPWRYQDTRDDDPNDVIDHQDRRELRGARVLAAWLNHFDAREQNTLAVWVEDEQASYVRHYYLDFGDSFGSQWDWEYLTRRLGHSNYFDVGDVFVDLITLGTIPRAWEQVEISPVAPLFGYFDAAHFDPMDWEPGYPNPAFSRMRDEDGAWMARILAHFTDEHIRAALDEAHLFDPIHDAELYRLLVARRDRILHAYLRIRSPLHHFEVTGPGDAPQLCFVDLASLTGVTDGRLVRYQTQMTFGDNDTPTWSRFEEVQPTSDSATVCIELTEDGQRPVPLDSDVAPDSHQRYAVLDVFLLPESGAEPIPPARLHFYDLGELNFQLVGIERPADVAAFGSN